MRVLEEALVPPPFDVVPKLPTRQPFHQTGWVGSSTYSARSRPMWKEWVENQLLATSFPLDVVSGLAFADTVLALPVVSSLLLLALVVSRLVHVDAVEAR